jgi:DNA-binding NarL/FixJ family response regulator
MFVSSLPDRPPGSTPREGGVTAPTRARVGIVEVDVILREALARSVASDGGLRVDGVAGSLQAGFALAAQGPDVLLVDLALPDGTGIDLIRHVHATLPMCRTLVITVFGDARHVVQSIEAGADGYLLKGTDAAEATSAIKTVLAGGAPISPNVARHLLGRIRSDRRSGPTLQTPQGQVLLTPREVDVLDALAKGFSFKEVAAVYCISPHTVADHVKAIYRKLKVNSRAEAVFEASQTGILKLGG